jgi:hypothetical protein
MLAWNASFFKIAKHCFSNLLQKQRLNVIHYTKIILLRDFDQTLRRASGTLT